MPNIVELLAENLEPIRKINPRLMSYNIEMAEVTGGTFWKAYTPGQIEGTEQFPPIENLQDVTAMSQLMQYYPPINLYDSKVRMLAKELGPAWVRVSGTWATKTYYDFDGNTGGRIPEGYQNVLTREQWLGVLDFVKAVNGKLLVSVSNCAGDHPGGGPLNLAQAEKLFGLSKEYGVPIDGIEFMNEPNMLELSGAPAGYTAADYARDQDILNGWVRENYPECILVGPCTTGDPSVTIPGGKGFSAGIGSIAKSCTTEELLSGTKVKLDVFSYHYYNGVSERIASVMPEAHWSAEQAHTDEYLAVASDCARAHASLRDRYVPGGQLWVTESGDAGGGGDTWASTCLDVFRTLNELGSFALVSDGVIFHNTLASSDYGFLQHGSFQPRPNYFAVLLWNKLMGNQVYNCPEPGKKEMHLYCHSRKDGKEGVVYLAINSSLTEPGYVRLPRKAEKYTLEGKSVRSSTIQLNGKALRLSEDGKLPQLQPEIEEGEIVELKPGTCTFFVL